MFVAVGYL